MKKLIIAIYSLVLVSNTFANPKPSMTCQPMDFKLVNAPKDTIDMVELNNQLNSGGMLVNMRCESKEAICFIVNNAMSCIRK